MRKLVCHIATSLDGYIAGPSGEIDWLFTDQDSRLWVHRILLDHWYRDHGTRCMTVPELRWPPTEEHFVFSRAPRAPDKNVTFVEDDFCSFVSGFKSRSGGTMWSVGDRSEHFNSGLVLVWYQRPR